MTKRILIGEDDALVANLYSARMHLAGYQVEIARDGVAGRDMVNTFKPDIVILDVSLPKLNGIEVLKQVRVQPEFKHLPIVVFSNLFMAQVAQEAEAAGATKCLSKSDCTPKKLIQLIQSLLADAGSAEPSDPRAPISPPPELLRSLQSDAEQLQSDSRKAFLSGAPTQVADLRAILLTVTRATAEEERSVQLGRLSEAVHQLSDNAGVMGLAHLSRVAAALHALLKELSEKPKSVTTSTLRTAAQAVDYLGLLVEHGNSLGQVELPRTEVLVVDDEVLCRRAAANAVSRAGLPSVCVGGPKEALNLLAQREFGLVIMDVDMPQMDGFETCRCLRALPGHEKTPVIFVTSHGDLESRAKSIISGGNDLIAKPFLFMELALKTLMHVLRRQLGPVPALGKVEVSAKQPAAQSAPASLATPNSSPEPTPVAAEPPPIPMPEGPLAPAADVPKPATPPGPEVPSRRSPRTF